MKRAETAALLGMMAAFDRRTIGDADVIAWTDALDGRVTFPVAQEAIRRHFRESTDWLMPARVIALSKVIIRERVEKAGQPDFPPDLTLDEERTWRRHWLDGVEAAVSDPSDHADRLMGITRPDVLPIDKSKLTRALSASKGVS